jgi:hypothetical protein
MHKSATKCNKTVGKWCKNKHGASKIIDTLETYHTTIQHLLCLFGNAFGLKTNIDKCVAYAIACEKVDLHQVLHDFGGAQGSLPCRYLGLPLGIKKPRRVEVQPLIDKPVGRLKGWKGKMLNHKGILTLINSAITATTTYFLTIFSPDPWLVKKLNVLRHSFF